ncbi:hypothetical protein BU17DRAFT_36234 [Hysterangium stoloniferum]|nr:hypothetical protein BU17DRAFT_36234 [Hysterangium stoloniferum]
MSDSVGSRSGFLCAYMSNHPDTLVAYVRHFGKVKTSVVSATMTSIDTKEMVLSYVVKGDVKKQVVIPFNPPLSGYDEVKPRLLGMKVDAQEALGMTKRPQITTFELRRDAFITSSLIVFLLYTTFSVARPYSSLHNIGPWIRSAVGGPKTISYIWLGTAVLHVFEALYMASLCRRHSTGLLLGAQWVLATLVLGFPALTSLRKLIQRARIDSITKIH